MEMEKRKTWINYAFILMVLLTSILILREINLPIFDKLLNKYSYNSRCFYEGKHINKWIISSDRKNVPEGFQDFMIYDFSTERTFVDKNSDCDMNCIKKKNTTFRSTAWIKKGLLSKQTTGYLVAISHGAYFIYSTDTDVTGSLSSAFYYQPYSNGLLFECHHYFNPYRYFEKNSVWPVSLLSLVYTPTPYIQTAMIHGDTRLTSSPNTNVPSAINDNRAPPVFIPAGVVSYYEASNTLFSHNSFWALLQPFSDSLKSCNTWQNIWSQRLLWEIGGKLGFFPSNMIKHVSTATSDTFQQYDWAEHLRVWTCPSNFSFFDCALLLSNNMTAIQPCNSFMNTIIKDWIHDLKSIGYLEPKRRKFNFTRGDPDTNFDTVLANISYMVSQKIVKDFTEPAHIQHNFLEQYETISSMCKQHPIKPPMNYLSKLYRQIYDNILLLIVFNFPHYDNIPKLELTYGAFFPRIVYCGSNGANFWKSSKKYNFNVTFIEVAMEMGFYNYRCMSMVMKINYKVDGYLFLGDDVLLNVRTIEHFPQHKIWISSMDPFRRSLKYHKWVNWQKSFGRPAFIPAWEELERLSQSSVSISKSLAQFKDNLLSNTGFEDGLETATVDIYYIPSRYQEEFIFYSDHFLKYKVFLEIATCTIIAGLVPKTDIVLLHGKYLWTAKDRNNFVKFFKKEDTFLHPVKFGPQFNSQIGFRFFCSTYYPLLLFGNS